MVMVGQAARLAAPVSARQKRITASVLALIVLAGVLVAFATDTGYKAAKGCVNVVLASSTGGALVHRCGASARAWCASELTAPTAGAQTIDRQCRLAGFDAPASSRR